LQASNDDTVSIVIPARNEEQTLGLVLDDLKSMAAQMPERSVEVIVVDDGSSDRTGELAAQRGARVLRNGGPPGKGRALRLGFESATGDVLVMMDADYSHRAEDIPVMLGAMKSGVGMVIGSRIFGGSDEYTPVRALGNVVFTLLVGLLFHRFLSDALNGFKAFRRDVFQEFRYTSRSFEIEIELLANALRRGYRVVEISSHERARQGGAAKSRVIRHGTGFLYRCILEWMRNKGLAQSLARKR
jgi:glycosyltransferase involved in cell wall biosynthesis